MITFDEFIEKLPDKFKPWGYQYGPAFFNSAVDDAKEAIALLIAGDTEAPLRLALKNMTPEQLAADGEAFTAGVVAHSDENAAKVASQKKAAQTGAGIILSLFLAMAGV